MVLRGFTIAEADCRASGTLSSPAGGQGQLNRGITDMMWLTALSTLGLFLYLAYALVKPERF
jgi:K+-transporting ATPase KdpF subunit